MPKTHSRPPPAAFAVLAFFTAAVLMWWAAATSLNSSPIAPLPARDVAAVAVVTRIAYVPITVTPTATYQPPPWWATSRAIHDTTATALALLPPTITPTPSPTLNYGSWWSGYVDTGGR